MDDLKRQRKMLLFILSEVWRKKNRGVPYEIRITRELYKQGFNRRRLALEEALTRFGESFSTPSDAMFALRGELLSIPHDLVAEAIPTGKRGRPRYPYAELEKVYARAIAKAVRASPRSRNRTRYFPFSKDAAGNAFGPALELLHRAMDHAAPARGARTIEALRKRVEALKPIGRNVVPTGRGRIFRPSKKAKS